MTTAYPSGVGAAEYLRAAAGCLLRAADEWTDEDQAIFDASNTGIRTAFGYHLEEVAATIQAFALELERKAEDRSAIVLVDRDGLGAL